MKDICDDPCIWKVVLNNTLVRSPQVHDDVFNLFTLYKRDLLKVVHEPVSPTVLHDVDDFLLDGITDDECVFSIAQVRLFEFIDTDGFGKR